MQVRVHVQHVVYDSTEASISMHCYTLKRLRRAAQNAVIAIKHSVITSSPACDVMCISSQ
jgi:hypothetical protein